MSELLQATTLAGWWDGVLRMTIASGTLLLAIMALDGLLARRASARWRAALYLAVFLRVLLPVSWKTPLGLVGGPATVAVAPASAATTAESAMIAPAGEAPSPANTRALPPLALHAGVAGLLLLGWAAARGLLERSLRQAGPADPRVAALAPRGLRVVQHPAHGPAVFGLLRPRIVMPASLTATLDDDALAAVMRHEAAHVSRHDPVRLVLLQLFTFLAWPLLPAWLATWRVRGLMEQACDEAALTGASASQRRAYGEALIRVASWQPLRTRLALGMLAFGGGLAPRLRALRVTRRWPAVAQVAVVAVAATGVLLLSGSRASHAGAPLPDAASVARDDGAPIARLDVRAWIADDATARAAWPVPGGLSAGGGVVPVSTSLSPLPADIVDQLRAALDAATDSGRAQVMGSAHPRMRFDSAPTQVRFEAGWLTEAARIALAAHVQEQGLAIDARIEWGTRPAGAPPSAGALEASTLSDQRGALLPAVFASRLASDRWGLVLVTGRSLDDTSPLGLIRDHIETLGCVPEALTTEGSLVSVRGTCPTPLALAHVLRMLDESRDIIAPSLNSQRNDPGVTHFGLSFSFRPTSPRRTAAVTLRLATIDADAAASLLPPGSRPGDRWDLSDESAPFRIDVELSRLERARHPRAWTISRPMVALELGQEGSIATEDPGSGAVACRVLVTEAPAGLHTSVIVNAPAYLGAEPLRTESDSLAWAVTRPIAGSDRLFLLVVTTQEWTEAGATPGR